jgi:hypothetical protein
MLNTHLPPWIRRSTLLRAFAIMILAILCISTVHAQDRRLMVLDPQFYLDKYPDLKRAFGPNNLEAAKQHWLNYGIKEGRQSSFFFSLPAYQSKNPDLWDHNVRTYEAVLNHYINGGYKEPRDATPTGTLFDMPLSFDPDFYQRYYPDIGRAFGGNFGAIVKHWREFGIKEGRLPNREALAEALKLGVDPEYYADRYPDLRNAFGTNATKLANHYKDFGRAEGRYAIPGTESAFESGPPSSGHGRQYLRKGDWLSTDQYIISRSRTYIAVQQADANFCVYKVGTTPQQIIGLNWCSRNVSSAGGNYVTVFQGDGNLCTYGGTSPADAKGVIACPSGPRNGDFSLVVQDDGNLVMYPGKTLATRTGPADWNVGYYKNPKESPFKWIANAASTVANGTVLAANTVANTAVLAANATAYGVTYAANQTAQGTTQLANTVANGTVLAANTVAATTVDVANQTANFATNMIDMLRGNCAVYSKYFPDPLAGMQTMTQLAQVINAAHSNNVTSDVLACASEFKAGYYCQIPEELVGLVSDVKGLGDVLRRSAEQSVTKECAGSFALTAPPLFMVQAPLACGAVKSMVEDSIKLTTCLIAAEKDGVLTKLITESGEGGGSINTAQACQMAGKVTLKIAKRVLTRQIPAGSQAAKVWSFFSKGALADKVGGETYSRLMALDACKGI